jgi:hypothetical protein
MPRRFIFMGGQIYWGKYFEGRDFSHRLNLLKITSMLS